MRRVVLVILVAAVAVLGACRSERDPTASAPVPFTFDGTAATVAGEPVPARELADTLAVFRAAPGAVPVAFGQDELLQAGSDQPQPAIVANILSTEIAARVIEAEVAARNLTAGPDATAVAETQINASFGDSLDDQPAFREELIRRYALYVALDQALTPAAPDEAALRQAYDADPARFAEQACARHILVKTKPEASDVVAQLAAGADFAALAAERSSDPGSGRQGGDLGCQGRGAYVPEFEAAVWDGPVGQVQGPVETQFGFHVIQVDQRGPVSFDEARSTLAEELSPQPFAPLREWLDGQLTSLPVTVDPRFGTWNPQTGVVDPIGVASTGLELTPRG